MTLTKQKLKEDHFELLKYYKYSKNTNFSKKIINIAIMIYFIQINRRKKCQATRIFFSFNIYSFIQMFAGYFKLKQNKGGFCLKRETEFFYFIDSVFDSDSLETKMMQALLQLQYFLFKKYMPALCSFRLLKKLLLSFL